MRRLPISGKPPDKASPRRAVAGALVRKLFVAAEAGGADEEVVTATFDLDAIRQMRANWGVFRDRRPDLYGPLLTLDGADTR